MDSLYTDRLIDHDEAQEIAQRFINSHFRREPCARVGIPARPDYDDDLLILAYIKQSRDTSNDLQRVLDAVLSIFGPEGLLKVDKHVKMARKSAEMNAEIDALDTVLSGRGGS